MIEETNSRNFDFVFISSLSAHTNNRSNYSRDKLELERLTTHTCGKVIKLGIVTEIPLSHENRIRKIQGILSRLRLDFLFSSADLYFTRGATLKGVSVFLRDFESKGETRSYFDPEAPAGIMVRSFWMKSLRDGVAFFLLLLSRLGMGQADALLNIMEGMRIPS